MSAANRSKLICIYLAGRVVLRSPLENDVQVIEPPVVFILAKFGGLNGTAIMNNVVISVYFCVPSWILVRFSSDSRQILVRLSSDSRKIPVKSVLRAIRSLQRTKRTELNLLC